MPEPEDTIEARAREVLNAFGEDCVQWLQIELMDPSPPPSKPGESPHKRSGSLYNSVGYRIEQAGASLRLVVEATAPHAPALEFGTDRMAPRPFMRPVFERMAPEFQGRLQSAFPH